MSLDIIFKENMENMIKAKENIETASKKHKDHGKFDPKNYKELIVAINKVQEVYDKHTESIHCTDTKIALSQMPDNQEKNEYIEKLDQITEKINSTYDKAFNIFNRDKNLYCKINP